MKEGFGDILYLVAMVGFFIFSAIMKSRKAKKNLPPQPAPKEVDPWENEEEESSPNFEDIFRTVPTTKVLEPVATPVVAEGRSDIVKERERITEQLFSQQQTMRSVSRSQKVDMPMGSTIEFTEIDETHDSISFWENEEFDLKKAVVFSEILKRPEI